eukprot:14571247-Ditylum_brightwellii.AAC.2
MEYEQLIKDLATKDIWSCGVCCELGRLAQGLKDNTKGTDTVILLDHEQIKNIPKDQTITYASIVVDFCPQKQDPYHVHLTIGGILIKYPGDVSTTTADLITSKLLWNSVLSTPNTKYVCVDIKNF